MVAALVLFIVGIGSVITDLDLKPRTPEILSSTDETRAIALMIPAGESLDDHQVHERARVTVLAG
jgi:hypothetical protein